MKTKGWNSLSPKIKDCINQYLDGTVSAEDFERLQDEMADSKKLRRVMRQSLALDQFLSERGDEEAKRASLEIFSPWLEEEEKKQAHSKVVRFSNFWPATLAACLAFGLGLFLMNLRNTPLTPIASYSPLNSQKEKNVANGFAVVKSLFEAQWSNRQSAIREGDALGAETIELESGIAQIQFYSGATMTLEGPARITLKSAWEAYCESGAVRMRVPPAARGFRLNAPKTQIVDLGTEFGFKVTDGQGQVEVFDGEIALSHSGGQEQILEEGDALNLTSSGSAHKILKGTVQYPDAERFGKLVAQQELVDFKKWQQQRDALAADERVAAYFTFEKENGVGLFPNLRNAGNHNLDAAPILANKIAGRWPHLKSALEFRRPEARVRVNITDSFEGFTFMSWVRIDSLDRQYNALFMADGYETGEPHWQIRDDGCMMLSVMVDDSRRSIYEKDVSGYHYVYFSPPMWEQKMSGKWIHLTSVYNHKQGYVAHFVDGIRISGQKIAPEFKAPFLKIGNGEIGNWGHPNRADANYSIRSINGSIGEMTIFKKALRPKEILELFRKTSALPQ
ncbi:MAG: LamG-like jellyroll fold domain-containing protein [Roseibacillus sp.]